MNTWAVLAAKEAAIASGLGPGILPGVGAGSLDGFAIGALMSGTCILMLTSPRRGRRAALASAAGRRARAAARGQDTEEEAGGEPQNGVPALLPDETGSATGERQDLAGDGGYRSRHRLSDQNEGSQRPGTRRSTPRHAAPSASFSARMTGRMTVRALAGPARG